MSDCFPMSYFSHSSPIAKIFLSSLHKRMMNKCWKFQEDILILVWVVAKWLKICCNQCTPNAQMGPWCALGGHWLQQLFSHFAITQTIIKVSSWNFQHLFIIRLCIFNKKNFGHNSNSLPAMAHFGQNFKYLSQLYLLRYVKKKKTGEVSDLYEWSPGRNFQYLLKNGVLKFFTEPRCPPSKFSRAGEC